MVKNRWKNYRNRSVYLNNKKIKLRKYIYVSANLMKRKNKKGWHHVDHIQNYKNALNIYGFKGLKIYEEFFYKGIPLPENRSFKMKLALFLAPYYSKFLNLKENIKQKLK